MYKKNYETFSPRNAQTVSKSCIITFTYIFLARPVVIVVVLVVVKKVVVVVVAVVVVVIVVDSSDSRYFTVFFFKNRVSKLFSSRSHNSFTPDS